MAEELRAYHFQNMYLQGIHAGIQTQHCTVELFLNYPVSGRDLATDYLYEWATGHKVTVVLNGGYQESLQELVSFLDSQHNPYPWSEFKESYAALNGCLTNVGIILPDKIFNYERNRKRIETGELAKPMRTEELTQYEIELAKRVASCKLMN